MDWAIVGVVIGIIGVILTGWLLIKYITDRQKDFGKGNRILRIEINANNPDRFEVTIRNENNVKKIGIYITTIENGNGLITNLYTIDELNNRPRMHIEAGGIETFVVIPRGYDPARFRPFPCKFSILDTNGKKDEVELITMDIGILYNAEP